MQIELTGSLILAVVLAIGSAIFTFTTMYQQVHSMNTIIDVHIANINKKLEVLEKDQAIIEHNITLYHKQIDKQLDEALDMSKDTKEKMDKIWTVFYGHRQPNSKKSLG